MNTPTPNETVARIIRIAEDAVNNNEFRVPNKDAALKLISEVALVVNADPVLTRAAAKNTASLKSAIKQILRWNLSPEKNQCYLICQNRDDAPSISLKKSYFGIQTIIRRHYPEIAQINASVVRQNEVVSLGNIVNGLPERISHTGCSLETLDNPIIGAYAVILNRKNEIMAYSLMSMKEIEICHQTPRGFSPVFRKYPSEMAKKTVLLRAIKPLFCTSDNNSALLDYLDEDEKIMQSEDFTGDITFGETKQDIPSEEEKAPSGEDEKPTETEG